MRTSRIAKETSNLIDATAGASQIRRSTRSSIAKFARHTESKEDGSSEGASRAVDIEDVIPLRKRKRDAPRTPQQKTTMVKTEIEDSVNISPARSRKVRKPARKVKNEQGEVEIHPPNDWAEVYAAMKEMRVSGVAQNAAVDTMGCERLGQDDVSPKVKRYHTLTALMLSSQTKDTTNALAMGRLQTELPAYKEGEPIGLNLENILAVDPVLLNELIWAVGFHNNKTKYIKATAEILRDKFGGDIPDTIEGMISLPGVGPKMAYLCMSSAWGRTEGIGVDVHVHRITNLWGWHQTKNPEETRLALQSWLPRELWHEINWLLVGFGQKICLPVGRKCGECELGLNGLCKAAERSKVTLGRKIREEKIKADEDGNTMEKEETVKIEEISKDIPVNEDPGDTLDLDALSHSNKRNTEDKDTSVLTDIPSDPEQVDLRTGDKANL
ncbi:DNA-glycosylase [Glarea lozoyensis ATCC 20868]|uniref:Endonuclease III homolog n=1 Tax=Glarea lozoyensis (strain ATCC 20868 / MF5171) TaxID=1116229 RepID=S3CSR9_GLAL2|nr:DNA-glycosylase [Glarea lozoyensis ATCC 20868]EPE29482.1 DNA-glycosylase [Glarea lozoyensis ATCC 20868]